jgi:DNA-binding LytR/AlgR family response regulator
MTIRVLIVDDEKPARDRLRRLLTGFDEVEVVGEASNGQAGLTEIARLSPELVFLDIQMPELDGLGVAQAIGQDGPQVVFATAYDQYALEAFDAAALDYLVKPISAERLKQALDRHRSTSRAKDEQIARVLKRLEGRRTSNRIAFKSGAKLMVVDPREIVAIQAEDHYSVIKGTKSEILCDDSLDAIANTLPEETFLRVHRSAIINLAHIESLDREGDRKYFAIMKGKERLRIRISRDRLVAMKEVLGIS